MSRHAVKIGEIHIVSDKPLTDEDRNEAITALARIYEGRAIAITGNGVRVRLAIDGDNLEAAHPKVR